MRICTESGYVSKKLSEIIL